MLGLPENVLERIFHENNTSSARHLGFRSIHRCVPLQAEQPLRRYDAFAFQPIQREDTRQPRQFSLSSGWINAELKAKLKKEQKRLTEARPNAYFSPRFVVVDV